MKKFTQTIIAAMGLITGTALMVLTNTKPATADGGGNQLMKGSTHWYEKAADAVKPAPEVTAKSGTLMVLQAGSYLYMEGDSTLHKYQMHANTLLGSAVLKAAAGGDVSKALKAGEIGSMVLTVPVNDFKSRESGLDNNAYKALGAKDNPVIKFVLLSETLEGGQMTAKGNLTIAGVTVPVVLSGVATVTGNKVEFKGVQALKMTDFKVTPPSISVIVTSITCTDAIAIHYDVIFAPAAK